MANDRRITSMRVTFALARARRVGVLNLCKTDKVMASARRCWQKNVVMTATSRTSIRSGYRAPQPLVFLGQTVPDRRDTPDSGVNTGPKVCHD
jgi:hypothetical protein